MKKLFTLILSGVILSFTSNGQALPNAGFENWTAHSGYDDPNGWKTLNSTSGILGVYPTSKSVDAHSGSFSLKTETKFIGAPFNQTAQGIVTTATTIITTPPYGVSGGIAFTERPDSVTGWIKYTPVNTDTGYIQVLLMNANSSDTIGIARFNQTTATDWIRFAAAFEYESSDPVELSQVILVPSSGTQPQVGSVVQFDDLAFVAPTGITETDAKVHFKVYPNPATDELFIKNPGTETAKMQVFDLSGKKVSENNIGLNTTRTNISAYAPGLYLYTFAGKNSEILHTGKFVITR